MKICTGCKLEKELTEFTFNKQSKDKLDYYCKKCNADKFQKKYKQNPEKHKRRNKQWNIENPEKRKEIRRNNHHNNKEKHNSKHREYVRNNRDKIHLQKVTKIYNITVDQYYEMLDNQKGLCAICERLDTANKRLAVDHCHETNKVRGLLCGSCNRALGLLKDSPKVLKNAFEYLKKHKEIK